MDVLILDDERLGEHNYRLEGLVVSFIVRHFERENVREGESLRVRWSW
jgi:hypothetical protein